jgi:hypothetical protein
MEIQASAAFMIQANSLNAVRDTLAATQAAPAKTPEQHADVILQLSTAAQQLMTNEQGSR